MDPSTREKAIRVASERLIAEVDARNEWYGLDNWPEAEVVSFVLDALVAEGFTIVEDAS